jgi:hypothetical protein
MIEARACAGHEHYFNSVGLNDLESSALHLLRQLGLVAETGDDQWQLSPKATLRLQVSFFLRTPMKLFSRRANLPLASLTTLELVLELESDDWTLPPIEDRKSIEEIKKHPYKSGEVHELS